MKAAVNLQHLRLIDLCRWGNRARRRPAPDPTQAPNIGCNGQNLVLVQNEREFIDYNTSMTKY